MDDRVGGEMMGVLMHGPELRQNEGQLVDWSRIKAESVKDRWTGHSEKEGGKAKEGSAGDSLPDLGSGCMIWAASGVKQSKEGVTGNQGSGCGEEIDNKRE